MESVTINTFKRTIAADFNISPFKEVTLQLPTDKKVIKAFTISVAHEVRIFDGTKESPYMLSGTARNVSELIKGIELRHNKMKTLEEILKETGVTLKTSKCKICEGGGWYSEGTRYEYKDIYCEF